MPRRLLVALAVIAACALALVGFLPWRDASAPPALTVDTAPQPAARSARSPTDRSPSDTPVDLQRRAVEPTSPRLTGRLVQRGAPLGNVVLRLHTMQGFVPTACAATVTTADDGTFATEGLPTGFWLRVEAPTVPFDWETQHLPPLYTDCDLGDLEPPLAGTLDLLVVDAAGHPVAKPCCWLARSEVQVGLSPSDVRAPRFLRGDANGKARLERLHPGPLYLKVSADGFAMLQQVVEVAAAAPPMQLQVTLGRGTRLCGRVFDWRGQPLAGAVASAEGRQAVTDASGAFALAAYGAAEAVHVEAKGHQGWWSKPFGLLTDFSHIQLERAVTLRGVVHGGNAATAVVLAAAEDRAEDLPWPGPMDKLATLLPVAADGTFAIEGLTPSDYVAHARAEGLGASPGLRVSLRDDTEVELTIDQAAAIALRVVDAEGAPVMPVEVVCDLGIVEYPSLFGPYGKDLPQRVFDPYQNVRVPVDGGCARVPVAPDEPLALGVRSRGFLPLVRVFTAGEAPQELTIELQRGGVVRGVVRGGNGAACRHQLSIWPAEQDAAVRARKAQALSLPLDAQGRFASEALPPGEYRAAVYRYGFAHIYNRPDQQVGAVPLVDEGEDLRAVVPFTLVAGATTDLELDEPKLGMLRGRVLLSGRPCAGAWVVAARPGLEQSSILRGGAEPVDWNSDIDLQLAAGQRSAADGSFTFLYRDAGPLEVRVRHADGAATMPPVVVDLPPPGDDVYCSLELALGGIRGRFVRRATADPRPGRAEAVLFPLDKAAGDPFLQSDWSTSLAWTCKRCELDVDGGFAFAHVPDGEWLVRITNGFDRTFVQRLVTVRDNEVDLGELQPVALVTGKLAWRWPASTPPQRVFGVWLYEERAGKPALWGGTCAAGERGAEACAVAPGRYLAVVFGARGEDSEWYQYGTYGRPTGEPLSKPFAIEIQSDGSTVPASVELVLEPPTDR